MARKSTLKSSKSATTAIATLMAAVEALRGLPSEELEAIQHIVETLGEANEGVTVKSAKPGRAKAKADASDDLEDDDDKPARSRRTRTAKEEKPARSRKAKASDDLEDDDELEDVDGDDDGAEDDGEAPELEALDRDSIMEFLSENDFDISDKYADLGLRELNKEVKDLGLEDAVAGMFEEGMKRSERTEMLQTYLSSIDAAIDAIAAFGYDDIKESHDSFFEDELELEWEAGERKTASTKARKAAQIYLIGLIDVESDD